MKIINVPQSGSNQGSTYSRSRVGQYVRTRATPVNPNTMAQSLARARFAAASQAWRGLTDAVRAAWSVVAAATPRQDSLGQTIYPTGAQMFIGAYAVMAQVSFGLPPAVPTISPPAAPFVLGFSGSIAANFIVEFSPLVAAPARVVFDMSAGLSAGVSFSDDLRFVVFVGAPVSAHLLLSAWTAKYGPPRLGSRIFLRVRAVTETGGASASEVRNALVTL